MDIHLTVGKRVGKTNILTMEDKSILPEGETEFHSQYDSPLVNTFDCTCTKATYDALIEKVGTLEAPALIASATAPTIDGRINTYIENGSLKILAQS